MHEPAIPIFAAMSQTAKRDGCQIDDRKLLALMEQAISTINRMVLIEAVAMGMRAGVPVKLMAVVIASSSSRSRQAEHLFDELLGGQDVERTDSDFVKFALEGILDAGVSLGVPLALTSAAMSLLALRDGSGIDISGGTNGALYARYEKQVGMERHPIVRCTPIDSAAAIPTEPAVIGYVGLGAMGSALARRAVHVARELHVFDPDPRRVEELTREGAHAAVDVRSLAARCDLIFVCVPSSKEVDEILFGPEGMHEALTPGKIIIDQTTCSPDDTRRMNSRLRLLGVAMIDAPVTGGPDGAAAGRLVTMCGGERDAFLRVKPVLDAIGGHVVFVGGPGCGQSIKLVKNAIGVANRLTVYEMLSVAAASGMRISSIQAALSGGPGGSAAMERIVSSIQTGAPTAVASLRTVLKDQHLVSGMGRATDSPTPLLSLTKTILEVGTKVLGSEVQVDELGRLYDIDSLLCSEEK